jgi:hypothetical protein
MENKETLEEASKRAVKSGLFKDETLFIAGAKWQQERMGLMEIELRHTKTLLTSCEKALEDRDKQAERMYSEEDLRQAFRDGQSNMHYSDNFGLDSSLTEQQWFKQFKKK